LWERSRKLKPVVIIKPLFYAVIQIFLSLQMAEADGEGRTIIVMIECGRYGSFAVFAYNICGFLRFSAVVEPHKCENGRPIRLVICK